MAALFLSGVLAYHYLPIAALPQIDYPTIQVQTFSPGASPEVMSQVVNAGPQADEFSVNSRIFRHHAAVRPHH